MTYLCGSAEPLAGRYDVALLDLDGVVYVGPDAVPAAPRALARARQDGMRLAFVTNNAARPAPAVAELLTRLGVPADPAEVITSAQTAAHYLARRLPAGAKVLVVGGAGLVDALAERGLTPVTSADDDPQAVVQGFSPDLDWARLSEGAVAIRRGAFWLATNLDSTVPSARGPLPGNGSLVAALRHATGVVPMATGKPDPTMHAETVERTGAKRPLVVGDRLDTDIEGAGRVGCASLLVFSGVTTPRDLLAAPENQRPDYLADDVSGLLEAHPAVVVNGDTARCGRWSAHVDGAQVVLSTDDGRANDGRADDGRANDDGANDGGANDGGANDEGANDGDHDDAGGGSGDSASTAGFGADALDALRALCRQAWSLVGSASGSAGRPIDAEPTVVHGADRESNDVLARLGLSG